VLELGRGDQVPVDGTVLEASGLELDEALLTGEAKPVPKRPGDTVLSGSAVAAGAGRIRADRVGADAYGARLQAEARRFSLIRSELQQGTNQILRLVTWVMVPAGLLLIASEFLRSHDSLRDAARGSAAGVVAMIPEGLVLLTSWPSRRARCGWPGAGCWCRNWRRSRAWPGPRCCASTRPGR
jgi:cation-transporting ATPase E